MAGRRTILIAGGGTGGHLMPALSIAAELDARGAGLEPVLVGAVRGVEARLLPTRDYRYHLLPSEPIYRRTWWKNVRWPFIATKLPPFVPAGTKVGYLPPFGRPPAPALPR